MPLQKKWGGENDEDCQLAGAAHNPLLDLPDDADIDSDIGEGVDALLDQEGRQVAILATVQHDEAEKAVGIQLTQAALLGVIDGGPDGFQVFVESIGSDGGVEDADFDGVAGVIQGGIPFHVAVGYLRHGETRPLLQLLGFALGYGGEQVAGVTEELVKFVQMEPGEGTQADVDVHAAVVVAGKPALAQRLQAVFDSLPTVVRGEDVGLRMKDDLEAVVYRAVLLADYRRKLLERPSRVVVVVLPAAGVLDFQFDTQVK